MIHPVHHLLVCLQVGLVVALVLTHTWLAHGMWLLLELAGIVLGVWAVAAMRLGQLRIHPEVAGHAELRTSGPYAWVRHPMYTALLLAMAGVTLDRPTPVRLGLFAALAGVLVIKLLREERLLRKKFPGYAAYASRTPRLIPFVW